MAARHWQAVIRNPATANFAIAGADLAYVGGAGETGETAGDRLVTCARAWCTTVCAVTGADGDGGTGRPEYRTAAMG